MGDVESALLEPVTAERAVVLADDETDGTLPRPDLPKLGAVLGAEPPRVCRRLPLLRGWSDGNQEDDEQELFADNLRHANSICLP